MNSGRKLPAAPPSLEDAGGAPRFGSYQGGLDVVDLSRLRGGYQPNRLQRAMMRKKWLYGFIATREVAVVFSVADLGYTSNAFALALDLANGRVLTDVGVLGLPHPMVSVNGHPGAGLEVDFRRPDARLSAWRTFGDERFHGHVRLGLPVPLVKPTLELTWDLLAAGAAPPLTVIAPVDGGVVNVTQKWAGLLAFGALEADGRRYRLDGGVGGLDYTQGYLARRTAWRWAFVCGRLDDGTPVGINLVEGFNEARDDVNENALWLGDELIPLGRARFIWSPSDVRLPWSVKTTDGVLDLALQPMAVHQELRDLKVVRSSFKQPVGLWAGEIKVGDRTYVLKDAPGVAEDQSVVW
jgi:Protein of unknown function (DUF2804)